MANKSTCQTYRKRPGTSGIRGQLYETKLLSLIYFRLLHDESIEEFHLATNVDDIGMFDDICLRAKIKDFDKPIVVFVQAKHRENDKILTLANKNDLTNYFSSYLKIKRRFETSNDDVLFKGNFNDADCVFVLYTTAKDDGNNTPCEGRLITYLNNIIGTGNPGSQPLYSDADIDLLYETVLDDKLATLAQKLIHYMFDDTNSKMMMNDEIILQYHVILAEIFFDISEIQPEGYRIASLKKEFLCESHQFPVMLSLKNALYSEILKRQKVDINEKQSLLKMFYTHCGNPNYLSDLIGNVILLGNNQIFIRDKTIQAKYKIDLWVIQDTILHEAIELAVKRSFPLPLFKVPATFGNKDIAIRGKDLKIEKRLEHLCSKLTDLIEKTKPNNIVTIDESMDVGLLRLNGGFASAIGNLFVFDEISMLFKFCENYELLGEIAKRLFIKLQSRIQNMHDYKFDMKIKSFARLSFNRTEYDDHVVKDFFSKFIFYSKQCDENDVEYLLKDEIESSQAHVQHIQIRSEGIFLKYHDEVQKWWMIPKVGSYLTKEGELYKNALRSASSSLMGILDMMNKIKYQDYIFKEDAVTSLQFTGQTIIVTESSDLTVAKLLRSMKNQDTVVLDMEYVLKLCTRDFNALLNELTNANEAIAFLIIVNKILNEVYNNNSLVSKRLEKIVLTLRNKNCVRVIISTQMSIEIVRILKSLTDYVIKDDRNNLTDLEADVQKNILKKTKVIFQGKEVSLEDLVDDVSIGYVRGEVLHEILNKHKFILGKSIVNLGAHVFPVLTPVETFTKSGMNIVCTDAEFQDARFFTRVVCPSIKFLKLHTLRELTCDASVFVGNPGMGKSTFLSQVSILLKKCHPRAWILRINLLEYAKKFSEWQENKTVIDTLESLRFMCTVAISEKRSRMNMLKISLEETGYGIILKECTGDAGATFELEMFLHCYNIRKVVFLFDGFDEICPHYAREVLALITVLRGQNKILITSRSYDKIVTILELQFKKVYKIAPWSHVESFIQLNRMWNEKKMLDDLNEDQLKNVYKFITFMENTNNKEIIKKRNELQIHSKKEIPFTTIYFWFIKYLKENLITALPDVMSSLNKLCDECDDRSQVTDEFEASPLLLNLISDYLYNKIREIDDSSNKWYTDTNIFKVYESVLETKLKRICFEEKNQIDMCKPHNILTYKKAYADFLAIHKKIAAITVFTKHRDLLFDRTDLNEFTHYCDMLKEGEEKTGIICNVVNNTPIFVHSTFAEYFAVEFICDLLKRCQETKRKIWDFILNVMFFNCNLGVLATLDAKIEIDMELTRLIKEENKIIFELLLEQSKGAEIRSSLCEAIRNDLRNLGKLLLSTTENNLNKDNLMDFIKIVVETKMIMVAIKMEYEEVIVTIVEQVRKIDKTKLSVLVQLDNEKIDEISTDEIIHELHKHVWTRMELVPDWDNLLKLSGQIYFI